MVRETARDGRRPACGASQTGAADGSLRTVLERPDRGQRRGDRRTALGDADDPAGQPILAGSVPPPEIDRMHAQGLRLLSHREQQQQPWRVVPQGLVVGWNQ